ncbi:acyl-CoA dehydrogenase C-terminal domain-containing protein [Reinekea marinisedimentorum]|uniref:3-methylmercaptopropionyl-CoA dehydrogenase n=1 Tax=Reinekea marinisedimentorum TaxID=230495 RepID=A0A4R3I9G9_9GAMM|nr:acyl-CoA dehydrogenase C-terminal domain-containing protein [Reinekea marinisedimentorum]TCS43039.1 alkylation response protein AidB-like acyl-CoA dehydrogenase [Reinekea marinisedimentorum]
MSEYKAPIRDIQFVLDEVFRADELWASMPATEDVNMELARAIYEEGARLCEGELLPLNRSGDEQGARLEGGIVHTPEGFKEAYNTFAESGWIGLGGDINYGGQGLPKMLTVMFEEMVYSANTSFALYPALTAGACLSIVTHGSETLKSTYLPPMYEGRWAGSMCLTEPHCGTDLGLLKTKAVPQEDGNYRLTGTKIFITGGDHDLTENIIHLVLAKLPDAPAGPRGISLFLVPKRLLDEQGACAEPNNVSCGSLEHKMGIKASATCVMNFDGATGYLIGEPNKGLAAMFTMMNYERLSIGLQGIGLGEVSYQFARNYALERVQSRSPAGAVQPDQPADPIIVHPDVRRMLLTMRAYNEGGRAFAAYVGMWLDIAKNHPDNEQKANAAAMVALLTPVAKAYFTDRGFDATVLGQQVFGGHGYIREWGMEQFVRDARIAQIYEGTNGIQALDLMGRKVVADGGEAFAGYSQLIRDDIASASGNIYAAALTQALGKLEQATDFVCSTAQQDPAVIGAASCDYLNLFGLVAYGHMWLKMDQAAQTGAGDFYQAKQMTAKYFFDKLLPEADAYYAKVCAGSAPTMAMPAEMF